MNKVETKIPSHHVLDEVSHSARRVTAEGESIPMNSLASLLLALDQSAAFSPVGFAASHHTPTMRASSQVVTSAMQVMAPADLTPAIEKFAASPAEEDLEAETQLTVDGSKPKGPDPFKFVDGNLPPLSVYLEQIVEKNPVMKASVSRWMEAKQSKPFHSTTVALVGQAMSHADTAESVKTRQFQLAQITEMIHVASLVHDEVVDQTEMKKIQVAVLAGDYLLSKASVALSKLQHLQVVELIASALDSLIEGRWMEGKQIPAKAHSKKDDVTDISSYLRKIYFKTASLFSNSCKSAALLAGYDENDDVSVAAEEFGYHLGIAYQIIDDTSDFITLSKRGKSDGHFGQATAPFIFASETDAELEPLIKRKFKSEGDMKKAIKIAKGTDCVKKSYQLAEFHAQKALDALMRFPESESREALVVLLHQVLSRKP